MRAVHPFDDDKLHEECGVFGIAGHADAAAHTALGLHALQHRGQQSSGIVSCDGEQFYSLRGPGQVSETFGNEEAIERLQGTIAIGHNRYSTTGLPVARNIQPLFADFAFGGVAVAHNGNLTNALSIRRKMAGEGALFQSTTDTEVIIHLIARSRKQKLVDRIVEALGKVEGAYSLVALSRSKLFGCARPARRAPAGARAARRGLDTRLRDLRARHHRGRLCPRCRARRDGGGRCRPGRIAFPLRPDPAPALHFRAHLFRAARQRRVRPQRL